MASREPRRTAPRNASTSLDPPGSRTAVPSSSNVNRRLFPPTGVTARRPVRQNMNVDASSSSSSTLRLGHGKESASSHDNTNNNDIIVRDPMTGTFTIDAPTLPFTNEPTETDEEEEARQRLIESWRKVGDSAAGAMVDQSEIHAVLMASLEEKVQGLEEDGWMFGDEEKEEDP